MPWRLALPRRIDRPLRPCLPGRSLLRSWPMTRACRPERSACGQVAISRALLLALRALLIYSLSLAMVPVLRAAPATVGTLEAKRAETRGLGLSDACGARVGACDATPDQVTESSPAPPPRLVLPAPLPAPRTYPLQVGGGIAIVLGALGIVGTLSAVGVSLGAQRGAYFARQRDATDAELAGFRTRATRANHAAIATGVVTAALIATGVSLVDGATGRPCRSDEIGRWHARLSFRRPVGRGLSGVVGGS